MYVVATAGHVDHGKSTLVRALTGMEPDRLAEEQRRGLTLDLGFAWADLGPGTTVAFVDVPGHERFVTTMLAGIGPVPAVLLVVAADEGWMPQTEEHVAAIGALGARQLLLAVTKSDVADPVPVIADARARLGMPVPAVAVSAVTGAGLSELREQLLRLVDGLPDPDPAAPVRLWVDRSFTVRGAGTVVTGTLPAGRVCVGDALLLQPAGRPVVVRGLQSLGQDRKRVDSVARVGLNLRGVDRAEVRRGMAVVTPDAFTSATTIDLLLDATGEGEPPGEIVAHLGSAAVPARCRRLGDRALRLHLAAPLPLHLGDRLVLREPASHRVAGAVVADLHPAALRRRGDAAGVSASLQVPRGVDDELERRGICRADEVRRDGLTGAAVAARAVGEWLVDPHVWAKKRSALRAVVDGGAQRDGVAVGTLRRVLDVPDDAIVVALASELSELTVRDGRVTPSAADDGQGRGSAAAPPRLAPQLEPVLTRLAADPMDAPEAGELAAAGVSRADLGRACSAGLLLRIADGLYVAPSAPERALEALATLPEPFTVSDARQALNRTRRVVVPLLEHLDAARRTRRLPDGTRLLVRRPT